VCVCVCVCARARLRVYTMRVYTIRVYISGVEGHCVNGSTDKVRGKSASVRCRGGWGLEEEGLFKRGERGGCGGAERDRATA